MASASIDKGIKGMSGKKGDEKLLVDDESNPSQYYAIILGKSAHQF